MNCHEFQTILHSLASGRAMDDKLQAAGLSHTDSCKDCRRQLENERQLAGGLRALAKEIHGIQALGRIETALLEAFRERKDTFKTSTSVAVLAHPVEASTKVQIPFAPADPSNHRSWIFLAAASALLVVGFGLLHWRGWTVRSELSRTPQLIVTPHLSSSLGSPKQAPDMLKTAPSMSTPLLVAGKNIHSKKVQQVGFRVHVRKDLKSLGSTPQLEDVEGNEIETGFLPVMAASPLDPTESGHLIRMKLPRSTLGRFGFPLNLRQVEEPVKADVLIGEDGVARAIRFVYTAEEWPYTRR